MVVPSARDGALRSAALPGRAKQHYSVWGAGLRVSFPKPSVPVVRWNLTGWSDLYGNSEQRRGGKDQEMTL